MKGRNTVQKVETWGSLEECHRNEKQMQRSYVAEPSQGSCKERGAREGWNLVVILICVFKPFVALLVSMKQEAPGKAVNKPMINCPF